jgi:hypothetical protein
LEIMRRKGKRDVQRRTAGGEESHGMVNVRADLARARAPDGGRASRPAAASIGFA